jgi:DNA-binding NarL/FixJ family response regulator
MTKITMNSFAPNESFKKGIVLMEDSEPERALITRELEKWNENQKMDIPIKHASSEDEVISLYKEGFQVYIVDIHMGENRQQEGLNVLERLKKADSSNFVAILSGKIEPFMRESILKKADFVQQKTGDRAKDIEGIQSSLHQKCERLLKSISNVLHEEAEKVEHVLTNSKYLDFISISSELERLRSLLSVKVLDEILENVSERVEEEQESSDPPEYTRLKSDPIWLEKNLGKYVVFVEGELIKTSENASPESGEALLNWLTQEKELYNKQRFFARVSKDAGSAIIDEPMSLSFDGFQY